MTKKTNSQDEPKQRESNLLNLGEHFQKRRVSDFSEPTDDPLEDLMNEFNDISDEFADKVELDQKDESSSGPSTENPTDFQNLPEQVLARQFSKAREFQTRIELLHEVNQRIKYYIDEIEMFLPKLKK